MDLGSLVSTVKKAAPLLGSALSMTGPAGAVASRLLSSALGTAEGDHDAALQALNGNPDAVLALKQLEATHVEKLQALHLEAARLEVEDRQGARARESAQVTATGKPDRHLQALAWTLVVGFLTLVGILVFRPMPPDKTGVVYMLLGTLAGSFTAVIAYYFGSSAGSKSKDVAMAQRDLRRPS